MIILLTSYNVLNKLELDVEFIKNPYGLLASDLFEVGARVNPKRSFLFVSKLIGKHLAVHPDIPKATGMLLANLFIESLGEKSNFDVKALIEFIKTGEKTSSVEEALKQRHLLERKEQTLFIGFAETATGLGHSVFSSFDNAQFIHTTREDIELHSVFDFEEEHSHATDHRCYMMNDEMIRESKHIVLIDDEMTTGKTSLNLIRSLHAFYPKEQYTILCLLDWRNEEQKKEYQKLERELNASISVVSLTQGTMNLKKEAFFTSPEEQLPSITESSYRDIHAMMIPKVDTRHNRTKKRVRYPIFSGRFGLSSDVHDYLEKEMLNSAKYLKTLREGQKTLVLGIGEFMYIPSRIASHMGENVLHKTTTRSPIYPSAEKNYPIHDRIQYVDDDGITYYAYNLSMDDCDEVFVILEKESSKRMKKEIASQIKEKGIKHVTFVTL